MEMCPRDRLSETANVASHAELKGAGCESGARESAAFENPRVQLNLNRPRERDLARYG